MKHAVMKQEYIVMKHTLKTRNIAYSDNQHTVMMQELTVMKQEHTQS